ncbi:hypothetical protein [Streptacidiphilus sp. MAP5-52]|uniref:hypothetical protein n=1 Tax=Streptacidiphilus sp. MAP5-52 TaxID=3156267 RepID=UPI0035123B6D
MRSIVAMVLYALHLRDRRPVDEIAWAAALWQLQDDQRAQALSGTLAIHMFASF